MKYCNCRYTLVRNDELIFNRIRRRDVFEDHKNIPTRFWKFIWKNLKLEMLYQILENKYLWFYWTWMHEKLLYFRILRLNMFRLTRLLKNSQISRISMFYQTRLWSSEISSLKVVIRLGCWNSQIKKNDDNLLDSAVKFTKVHVQKI